MSRQLGALGQPLIGQGPPDDVTDAELEASLLQPCPQSRDLPAGQPEKLVTYLRYPPICVMFTLGTVFVYEWQHDSSAPGDFATAMCGFCCALASSLLQLACWHHEVRACHELGAVLAVWRVGAVVLWPLSALWADNFALLLTACPLCMVAILMVGSAIRTIVSRGDFFVGFLSAGGVFDVVASMSVLLLGCYKMVASGQVQVVLSTSTLVQSLGSFALVLGLQLTLSQLVDVQFAVSRIMAGTSDAVFRLRDDLTISKPTPGLYELLGMGVPDARVTSLDGESMEAFLLASDAPRVRDALLIHRLPGMHLGPAAALPIELLTAGREQVPVDMFHVSINRYENLVALRIRGPDRAFADVGLAAVTEAEDDDAFTVAAVDDDQDEALSSPHSQPAAEEGREDGGDDAENEEEILWIFDYVSFPIGILFDAGDLAFALLGPSLFSPVYEGQALMHWVYPVAREMFESWALKEISNFWARHQDDYREPRPFPGTLVMSLPSMGRRRIAVASVSLEIVEQEDESGEEIPAILWLESISLHQSRVAFGNQTVDEGTDDAESAILPGDSASVVW